MPDRGSKLKSRVLVTFLFVLVFMLLGAFAYYILIIFDNNLPFLENDNVVPAFEEDGVKLIIEGEMVVSKDNPRIVDNEILLTLDTIKKHIDPHIYWDKELKKVTITTRDRVIRMKTDSLDALVNNKPMTLNIPAVEEGNTVYIPIEFLSEFYGIDISHIERSNVIVIDFKNSLRQIAEPVDSKAVVRKGRSIRYPIIRKFDLENSGQEENALRIFEEYDKWYKVRTSDGAIGYIEKRFVVVRRMLVVKLQEEEKGPLWKPEDGKISLVWEMMYSKVPDLSLIGEMKGLDVISPTWFQLANEHGEIINRAVPRYVEWARRNGYKVWALFSNDFNDIKMTEKFLNNTDARDNAIREILAYAALYKLDGINIDFENMYKKDKDAFTQFVREMTPLLREQGLVVSVDVTIPDGSDTWSLCYDRKALGEVADYVALMTYDQHWSTSPVAGSVSQVSWVERNIVKVLKEVPREKLLLGLPFYTRLWQEEAGEDGKIKVSNPKALSMEASRKMVQENNAPVTWDKESGQFYTEFKKDNKTYKIWLEDENSINLKSALVHKYKLAGTAAWRRSDEIPEVWDVLNENLKVVSSYQEWKSKNEKKVYVYSGILQAANDNK